ncbi:MAG: 60S ribosomal protein L38 [Cercozoa sp. M6MM]
MPKEIKDVQDFIKKATRADAKSVRIKKAKKGGVVKFKLRCSRFLYTLSVKDQAKAKQLQQTLPPALTKIDI